MFIKKLYLDFTKYETVLRTEGSTLHPIDKRLVAWMAGQHSSTHEGLGWNPG